jgi:hypothetical protein
MKPSTYGHASIDGQSPQNQNIIKIEVNTKKTNFLKEENYYKSDTIYQSMVIIPYVRGISEKFRRIGNHFNVRTIFRINIHSVGLC